MWCSIVASIWTESSVSTRADHGSPRALDKKTSSLSFAGKSIGTGTVRLHWLLGITNVESTAGGSEI